MHILNPHTVPLKSINLIEASAGTGKSWTVTLLYLRLILELDLTVDQILVVTFTDAATKELRNSIRTRILEALAVIDDSDSDLSVEKPEYKNVFGTMLADDDAKSIAKARLERAKFSIDEATIFTIHSFCQRALNENAFEASLPFESELIDDDKSLMQSLVDNYWRRNFQNAPDALVFQLQQQSITPDSLLNDIYHAVGKPYLEIKGPSHHAITEQEWQLLSSLFDKAKETWQMNSSEITQILLSHGGLNKRSYSEDKLLEMCQIMNECDSSLAQFSAFSAKLYNLGEEKLQKATNKGFDAPLHSFFSQWQAFLTLWDDISSRTSDYINQVRIDLLIHLQNELPKEKKRLGVLSFDDLLLQLQTTLQTNEALPKILRQKYKAALIDEFQDTDPIQYDIFSTIFESDAEDNESAVFLVGDPKQAIYSFRGGDIHTYLRAKQNTPEKNHYTLKTNYRSHPKLISAYNTLYELAEAPFQDEGISYVTVDAGKKDLDDFASQHKPLQFWTCQQEEGENADAIKRRIAKSVAGDITSLLNSASVIDDKPISGGDIAILVRSHSQGDIIKNALNQRGISSVQSSKKTIFQTHEASELAYLLIAIVDPSREDCVRRALVTEIMGHNASDLLTFENQGDLWEEQLAQFQQWHFQWKNSGFLPMMRTLMQASNMHQRLLAYGDGERRLTNILHLSELIHRVTHENTFTLQETLRWLKKQQEEAVGKEGELRLESDENLVKIVTIHKSKGLEYPIVYCPFIGLGGGAFKDRIFSFYDDNKPSLEIGSKDFDAHKALKAQEEMAESTRLLYVALTRARYQCTVVCFPDAIKRSPDRTALGWLITRGETTKTAKDKKNYHAAYHENLIELSEKNGNIGVADLPLFSDDYLFKSEINNQEVSAKVFSAEIKLQAQVTSFSALTYASHKTEATQKPLEEIQIESPDHDSQKSVQNDDISANEDEFPRGATAGSALHEIFENIDFIQPINEQHDIVENCLNQWGFDKKHHNSASALVETSLQAKIFDDFSLDQLNKSQRLDEMAFYLPLNVLDVVKLQSILLTFLPQDSNWNSTRDAVKTLSFKRIEGFLKGYIDLIFMHEDQYYVVDYKSNVLEDYAPENLMSVMASSHYYLQYLLYTVALHRYLKKRLPSYSWEDNMGGSYYLFIRGLHKNAKNRGGVFFNKPSFELINALDGLFMESLI